MKKIISFSLWGNSFRYLGGAIQNINLAKLIYPDWVCRFYVGKSTDKNFVDKIMSYDNVEVITMDTEGDLRGMYWRFIPAYDDSVDVMISRDCDSRLTHREKLAVDEWIHSNYPFHIMRDNPNHNIQILGGMWGIKPKKLKLPLSDLNEYEFGDFWQTDQFFLRDKVYPLVVENSLIHEESIKFNGESHPFPKGIIRDPNHFVGQAYDGNGKILDKDIFFHEYLKFFIQNFNLDM